MPLQDQSIVQCFKIWQVGYCWKLTQFILDMAVLILASLQLIIRCRYQFSTTRIKYCLYYLIILTSLTNLIHQLVFKQFVLFDLSIFFFNIYFTTILSYAGLKLLENTEKQSTIRLMIALIYIVAFCLHLILFIFSVRSPMSQCITLWYIIVRTIGVLLAICLCVIGKFHEIRAKNKLKQVSQMETVRNPLPKLWCWVSINILAQFINLIRTFIFAFVKQLQCEYDKQVLIGQYRQNLEINYFLELLILLITFYMPLFSTIYIFWQDISCKKERKQSFVTQRHSAIGIQLVRMDSR